VVVDDHLGRGLDIGVHRTLQRQLAGLDLVQASDRGVLDEGVGIERARRAGGDARGRSGHVLGDVGGFVLLAFGPLFAGLGAARG
jgi:hypothetical protein